MVKYLFKLKSSIIVTIIMLLSNAYLIFLFSRYIVDSTISHILVFLTNEIFIFMGILFYMLFDLNFKFQLNKDKQNLVIKELLKENKRLYKIISNK